MIAEDMLIDKAKAGDRDALNELVSLHWQPIYRLVCHKVGNLDDAQEITQDTFVKALRSLPNYRKTNATFKTYLSRIALNLITDFWRKKGRSPAAVDLAEYQQPIPEEDQPDAQAISQEMRTAIAAVLNELPAEQKRTIEYRIIAGLPVKDTATAMGKSEAAIKMLQQRALKNLRALLLDKGIIENCLGG